MCDDVVNFTILQSVSVELRRRIQMTGIKDDEDYNFLQFNVS
jgi:hypothetical protein